MIELAPTELLADTWKIQDRAYADGWWLKQYWDSTDGSHRDTILDALEGCQPASSLLEVGCNTGPNLRRIHQRWPQMDLMGMDIHPGALKFGQENARAEGWHFSAYPGDLRELSLLGENIADVVLSCYALAYLDPRDIQDALDACVRAARRAVILCEPMTLGTEPERFLPGRVPGDGVPEYQYNYVRRLAMWPLRSLEIVPPHGRLAHIVTLRKVT